MDININIKVDGGNPTVSVSKPAEKKSPMKQLGILKINRKTKHGHETILRTPPMVESGPQKMGILQGLGL